VGGSLRQRQLIANLRKRPPASPSTGDPWEDRCGGHFVSWKGSPVNTRCIRSHPTTSKSLYGQRRADSWMSRSSFLGPAPTRSQHDKPEWFARRGRSLSIRSATSSREGTKRRSGEISRRLRAGLRTSRRSREGQADGASAASAPWRTDPRASTHRSRRCCGAFQIEDEMRIAQKSCGWRISMRWPRNLARVATDLRASRVARNCKVRPLVAMSSQRAFPSWLPARHGRSE